MVNLKTQRLLLTFGLLVMLFVTTGASCPRMLRQYRVPTQVVFENTPTLAEAITVVNTNSAKISQLQTIGAKLTVPGAPRLRASASYQRDRDFRLIADTGLTGVELDMGSNSELFWMWVKRNDPPAVYYCRHDQLHGSGVHQVMPIEPGWLIEAMGVVTFDPRDHHEGPNQVGQGRLEIQSHLQSGHRQLKKVTVIDDSTGWVLEQHLYDSTGTRIASAIASQHQRDETSGVTLPRRVEITMPTMEMRFTIDVADYAINQLDGDPASLFAMPQRSSAQAVDLGQQRVLPVGTGPELGSSPAEQPANWPRNEGGPYQPDGRTPGLGTTGEEYPANTRIYESGRRSSYDNRQR